jgi:hypothetical protein
MAGGEGHAMAATKGGDAMAHQHDLHVMPHDDGWKIMAPGHDDPLAITRTQEEAIHLATQMQHDRPPREGGEVLIHGRDGRIRERNTINRKDPYPPRG